MKKMSELSGLSYGTVNVLLFIILGPLSTILAMLSSALLLLGKKKISMVLLALSVVIVLLVCGSVLYAFGNCV